MKSLPSLSLTARWLVIATLCFSLFTACKKQTRRARPLSENAPVSADHPEAQADFDQAFAALKQGDYAASSQGFERVQAQHGDDAIAPVAELYAARSELGELRYGFDFIESALAEGALLAVAERFDRLASERRVDDRVRFSASMYSAIARFAARDHEGALDALKSYPSATLNALVLERDRVAAWTLLLEAMKRQERFDEALVAAAMMWEGATSLKDLEVSARAAAYARAAGAWLALERIDSSELQGQFLPSDVAFLRGFAGWALIARHEGSDEASREALEAIISRSAPALLEVGAMEQAVEAQARVATMSSSKRLLVGALVPMQGKSKGIGARVMRGMLLAQSAFASSAEGARLTVVFRDATLDASQNMAWFKEQGALAVIGPIDKDRAEAYVEAARAAEVALLPLTPDRLKAPAPGASPWAFRTFLDIDAEAQAVARVSAGRYGDRTAAIIWPNVGYGRQMAESFKRAFEAEGGRIVAEVEYPRQDTEFTRTAAKVAKARPDAVFIADTGAKVSEITAFLAKENLWGVSGAKALDRTSRLQTHYLGTSLWQDDFLLDQASAYVAGATIPAWYSSVSEDGASRAFRQRYEEVFSSGAPSIYEAFAYDATMMLESVIVQQGVQRTEMVREALLQGSWGGVTGEVNFTESGEADRALRFITVKGERFAPLEVTQRVEASRAGERVGP